MDKTKLKPYKPHVFEKLRRIAGVDEEDYMASMCSQPLAEIINPGASGASLYTSSDGRLIVKTVQNGEAAFLKEILKDYLKHLEMYPQSLLPRFLGYYTYEVPDEGKRRLVVMKNLFAGRENYGMAEVKMSGGFERFDLKGSRYGRHASQEERAKPFPTLKDLDFIDQHPMGIEMDGDTYDSFMMLVRADCLALQEWDVMDYSLLVGISQVRSDGGGMPAKMCGSGDEVELYAGIIDILQEYTILKRIESAAKGLIRGKDVSVADPKKYRKRFESFISEVVLHRWGTPSATVSSAVKRKKSTAKGDE